MKKFVVIFGLFLVLISGCANSGRYVKNTATPQEVEADKFNCEMTCSNYARGNVFMYPDCMRRCAQSLGYVWVPN